MLRWIVYPVSAQVRDKNAEGQEKSCHFVPIVLVYESRVIFNVRHDDVKNYEDPVDSLGFFSSLRLILILWCPYENAHGEPGSYMYEECSQYDVESINN